MDQNVRGERSNLDPLSKYWCVFFQQIDVFSAIFCFFFPQTIFVAWVDSYTDAFKIIVKHDK